MENGTTRQTMIDLVSAGYLETLGVRPILGRDFTSTEERPGSTDRVVMISHGYWKRRGFDPDVNSMGGDARMGGIDIGAYPRARTWNAGVSIAF